MPCKSGRNAVTTHGGTSFHDGFLPRAGPRVLTTGCPPHDLPRTPIGPGGESAAPAGPPPLAPHPNRSACPPPCPTRFPRTRCGSSRAEPAPCLRRVHPHRGWTFHKGFNGFKRRVNDVFNEGGSTETTIDDCHFTWIPQQLRNSPSVSNPTSSCGNLTPFSKNVLTREASSLPSHLMPSSGRVNTPLLGRLTAPARSIRSS